MLCMMFSETTGAYQSHSLYIIDLRLVKDVFEPTYKAKGVLRLSIPQGKVHAKDDKDDCLSVFPVLKQVPVTTL